MKDSEDSAVDVLPAGDARPRRHGKGARVAAGACLALAGLVLILLGGCFLIGATAIVNEHFRFYKNYELTGEARTLVNWCYGAGVVCFLLALTVLALAIRGLTRLMFDDGPA